VLIKWIEARRQPSVGRAARRRRCLAARGNGDRDEAPPGHAAQESVALAAAGCPTTHRVARLRSAAFSGAGA